MDATNTSRLGRTRLLWMGLTRSLLRVPSRAGTGAPVEARSSPPSRQHRMSLLQQARRRGNLPTRIRGRPFQACLLPRQ